MLQQINKENFQQMLGQFSTGELEGMVEKFPYFEQAHLLIAKKYQQENSPKFDQQLQLAALYVQDRELLYTLFNEKGTVAIPIADTIISTKPEAIEEIPVPVEEVSSPIAEIKLTHAADIYEPVKQVESPKEEEKPLEDANLKAILEEIERSAKQLGTFTEKPVEEKQVEAVEVTQPEIKDEAQLSVVEPVTEEIAEPVEEEKVLALQIQPIEESIAEVSLHVEQPVEEKPEEPIELLPPATEEVVNEATHQQVVIEEQEEPELDESSLIEEKPVEVFSRIEPHTFDEWLKAFNNKSTPEVTEKPVVEKEAPISEKDELAELLAVNISVDYLHDLVKEETTYAKGLERFIEEQIEKHKQPEAKKQAIDNDPNAGPATETMAKVYEMQKKYAKAIKTYEALTLKFPEKSSLFAARINYLKNIL